LRARAANSCEAYDVAYHEFRDFRVPGIFETNAALGIEVVTSA
jgi:hypothetical protein